MFQQKGIILEVEMEEPFSVKEEACQEYTELNKLKKVKSMKLIQAFLCFFQIY